MANNNHTENQTMSKHTLGLILGLFVISILLLFIAITANNTVLKPLTQPTAVVPSPTPIAHTILSLSPNPIVTSSQSATIAVNIDTGPDKITGAQIELAFDPKVITSVTLQPGSFFPTPIVLIKNVNYKTGSVSYALVTNPGAAGLQGAGTVATIIVKTALAANQQTEIQFLPKSIITMKDQLNSMLKLSEGTSIMYVPVGTGAAKTTTQTPPLH